MFTDVVLVGNIDDDATDSKMKIGLSAPDQDYWFVSGVYAKNMWGSTVLSGCGSGCTMRYEGCTFVNSFQRTRRNPEGDDQAIFWDLDGTLTGFPHGFVIHNSEFNRFADGDCTFSPDGHYGALVCGRSDGSLRARLLTVRGEPWQLYGQPMTVKSEAGTAIIPGGRAWSFTVIANHTYDIKVNVPNDFEKMALEYSTGADYVLDDFQWRTPVHPISEGVKIHINYSHWRDHFEGTTGPNVLWKVRQQEWVTDPTGALGREPILGDAFGAWSHKIWQEDCEQYRYNSEATREMCFRTDTQGYALSSPPELKWVLDQQPDVPRAEGRVTTVLTTYNSSSARETRSTIEGNKLNQILHARECPVDGCVTMPVGWVDVPAVSIRRWSNASSWTCGRLSAVSTIDTCVLRVDAAGLFTVGDYDVIPSTISFRIPGENDDVIIAYIDQVLLDVRTPRLNWVTVHGSMVASTITDSALIARSVVVWGQLEIGTEEDPVPSSVTAGVELWGDDDDHTVVVSEGLFAGSKTMVVLGTLSMVGAPSEMQHGRPTWTKLAETANMTNSLSVQGDASWWPVGSQVGVGATEYPTFPSQSAGETETEVRTIAAAPVYDSASGRTTVFLNEPLQHSHYAGRVGSTEASKPWGGGVDLSAAVSLLGGRSNVVFKSWKADQLETGHGATLMVGGSRDGAHVGVAKLIDMEFVGAGKHLYQHPALHFKFLHHAAAQQQSRVEQCVFSQSNAGAIVVDRGRNLEIIGNVFHRTYRSAVWINPNCARNAITLVGNLALETLRHPLESTTMIRPFAAYMLEVPLARMTGNVAAGSGDFGFVFVPDVWSCDQGPAAAGTPWEYPVGREELNEAVGCVIGFFMKNPCQTQRCGRRQCARLRGALAWKNSQIGLVTLENEASVSLDSVAVADNHIGVNLLFSRPKDGTKHRTFAENMVGRVRF